MGSADDHGWPSRPWFASCSIAAGDKLGGRRSACLWAFLEGWWKGRASLLFTRFLGVHQKSGGKLQDRAFKSLHGRFCVFLAKSHLKCKEPVDREPFTRWRNPRETARPAGERPRRQALPQCAGLPAGGSPLFLGSPKPLRLHLRPHISWTLRRWCCVHFASLSECKWPDASLRVVSKIQQ